MSDLSTSTVFDSDTNESYEVRFLSAAEMHAVHEEFKGLYQNDLLLAVKVDGDTYLTIQPDQLEYLRSEIKTYAELCKGYDAKIAALQTQALAKVLFPILQNNLPERGSMSIEDEPAAIRLRYQGDMYKLTIERTSR